MSDKTTTEWATPVPLRSDISLSGVSTAVGVYHIHSRHLGFRYVGMATNVAARLAKYRSGSTMGGFGARVAELTLFGGALHEFHAAFRPDPVRRLAPWAQFVRSAIDHLDLEVSVAYTPPDATSARALEAGEVDRLAQQGQWLLNRAAQTRVAA